MISIEDTKHLTKLSRLELESSDLDKFQHQLSDVLGYMEKLNEVDTKKVPASDGGTRDLFNVWRSDGREAGDGRQEAGNLIKMAPESERGQVKVKKIL